MKKHKPKEAAKLIGVSYPTIKQWIYDGKIKSDKTPGGHHLIPENEIERLSGGKIENNIKKVKSSAVEVISVRNKLMGRVTHIKYEGLFAEVIMDVGGQQIISIITRSGCEDLNLRVGGTAYALFKATEVMISRR